ncbi:MAG: hypothetical protein EHM61_22650 [Acidobacteria bacterium]|nr:MAG: hypothetical protein EHM61_22650 [Acidobacteriota bacterium]
MKQILALVVLLVTCSLTFGVDPVSVRVLERDLAGQPPVFQAQSAKSTGRSRLIITLAGAAMIGAGVYLAATSNQTVAHTIPVSSGGPVVVYKTLYVEETNQRRRYGGITMAGAGGVLVWQGLMRIH